MTNREGVGMPAKDLGAIYVCFKCSTKFYDLRKPDPVCPKCGTDQRESPALRPAPEPRRGRTPAPKPVEPILPEEPEVAEEEEVPAEEESFEDDEEGDLGAEDEEV